jgi:mannose/cellobiose epimerase-like protein (N-acyl-D-glucosamine 2-epimerase family)
LADPLESAAATLLGWAVGQALPLWAGAGFDREHERFEERLTLAGARLPDVPVRVMVQARQIHSYALAHRRGWYRDVDGLVGRAYRSMVRDYHRRDGQPGWLFSIHRDGRPAGTQRDLYGHAFVLLAIGSYVGATGDRTALALADETLADLDRHMRATGGGYVDAIPPIDAMRRQNPHMHVFEALLTLWSHSGEGRYLARAGEMFGLFAGRFFQPGPGVLVEYFDDGLMPASGPMGGIVEPGHQLEWLWLLRWYERESGTAVGRYADALYAHADRYGTDAAGLIVDELLVDGSVRTASRRLWPMTEAIKAHLVEARLGRAGAAAKAQALADRLFERFLSPAMPGGWIDRLDAAGNPAAEFMPASSLYHLLGAIDELSK